MASVAQGAVVTVIALVAIIATVSGARRARRFALAQHEGPNDLLRAGAPAGTDDPAAAARRAEGKHAGPGGGPH